MTPVKNQGGCGSCSCFSATSALEGVQSIKSTEDSGNFTPAVRLSEQQGLDCTSTGCRTGGWMQWYFDFARENGANTNEQYPYQAVDGEECLNDPSTAPPSSKTCSLFPLLGTSQRRRPSRTSEPPSRKVL